MFKRILNKLRKIINNKSNEQLSIEACIAAGMKVGKNVYGLTNCTIDYTSCWLIEIGDNTQFAPEIYILAHDTSTKMFVGHTKVGKVIIEDGVFIGARTFIMPNVTIGKNSIIGSNSLVSRDIPPNVVAAGNPARVICTIEEYAQKVKADFDKSPQYDKSYSFDGGVTDERKKQMINEIKRTGYVQ